MSVHFNPFTGKIDFMSRAEYISRLGNEANIFVSTDNKIGIGSTTPAVSFDVSSETDGILIPSGTTDQRPSTASPGVVRYNRSIGQFEVSNGSSWGIIPVNYNNVSSLSWNQSTDTYPLTSTVIDVQSRMRRCLLLDNGTVNYYLDADDSTKRAGDWLRIVETQTISVDYTGTLSESANTNLRSGVPNWSGGTYVRGQRVIYNNQLWECIAASTTSTPAAGSTSSDLTGAAGQVMVEIPAFSVRYNFASNVHTWEVTLGITTSNGFTPHPAFLKANSTYRPFLYVGAYQVTGTSPATTVSGASNRVSMTRATQRSASAARGSGWHTWSQYDLAAIQILMITEFQTMNSQRKLGNGAMNGSVYVVNTGLSNGQGNKSQNSTTPSTGSNTDYVSYRGLENVYGRAWQWTDGMNANGTSIYLASTYANFADDTATNYTLVGTIASGSGSYQTALLPLSNVFLPSAASGGSATTYIGDGLWTSTGWRVSLVGGCTNDGSLDGVFCLFVNYASSGASSDISARLAFGSP